MAKNSTHRRWFKLAPVVIAGMLLTACQSELYSDLSEKQANEMVRVLAEVGISATRNGTDGKFSVQVDRSNFSSAIAELSAKGLPRQNFGSLGKIFNSEKLVSTPFEERARFMHALNEELSDSISRISGVTSARVHLMVPESTPFEKMRMSPRASVFIYKSENVDLAHLVPTIKNLVVNSLDNLEYENVEVAMFDTSASGLTSASPSVIGKGFVGDLLMLGLLALGVLFGLKLLRRFSGKAREAEISQPVSTADPMNDNRKPVTAYMTPGN